MQKCPKCGTEFEGKFCPDCGEKWQEEKKCPSCGATLSGSARFCNECGYSFYKEESSDKAKPQSRTIQTVYSLLKFAPAVIVMLFATLLFAFYAAPVASVILGDGFPNQSLGNVYSMQSGILSEIPELATAMILLIVFAVIFFIAAAATVFVRFKKSEKANKIFFYVPFAIYLLSFIVGIVIVAQVKKFDEGMGVIGVGACPILITVFAPLFALLGGGATFLRSFLGKKNPELAEEEAKRAQEAAEAERVRRENFYATHAEPQLSGESNKERIEYKHRKRLYDKAKEGEPNKALVWLDLNKVLLASMCVILVVAITAVSIVVPIVTSKFRANVVSKIDLGDTPEQVRTVLGDPTTETEFMWKYYDKDYSNILKKLEKNGKQQEEAFMSNDLSKLTKLVSEEEKLTKKLGELKYDYIEIDFEKEDDATVVSSVLLDKNRCDSREDNKKEVKKVNILSAEGIGYYNDYTNVGPGTKVISYNDNNIHFSYEAFFKDKSYRKIKKQQGKTEYNGSDSVLKWEDEFASYENSIARYFDIKIGEVSQDGVWKCESQNKDKIVSLILPDNVTSIGKEAFRDCENLTSLTLPNNLISIGEDAFGGCTSLQYEEYGGANYLGSSNNKYFALIEAVNSDIVECTIHDDTRIIAGSAFNNCQQLSSITIPDNVISIGASAFKYCYSLTSITIGDGVTFIGNEAFYYCDDLTNITLPNSLTSIGEGAFSGCTSLQYEEYNGALYLGTENNKYYALIKAKSNEIIECTIQDDTRIIAGRAFYNCDQLTSVTIPDNVISIGTSAFLYCLKLIEVNNQSSFDIVAGRETYGGMTFNPKHVYNSNNGEASNLDYQDDGYIFYKDTDKYYLIGYSGEEKDLILPDNYHGNPYEINENAFYGCESLTSITISDSVTTIGDSAFSGCNGLTSVTIPDSVTTIGDSAFSGCNGLTSITIPDSVTTIGWYVFEDCRSLENVTIPDSVTSIGHSAFSGCKSLTSITIGNGITSLDEYVFYDCSRLKSVTIGKNVQTIGDYAFYKCGSLTSITIPDSVTSIGWFVFEDCSSLESVILSENMKEIDNSEFWDCVSLQYEEYNGAKYLGSKNNKYFALIMAVSDIVECTIHDDTRIIAGSAFYGCESLTNVTISDSVTTIGNSAFGYCSSLSSVTIGKNVQTIGASAFYACYNLTSITIPGSVTSIGASAFYGCESLTSVTINNGVISIYGRAFRECVSLTSITIPDSVTSIGASAFYGCESLTSVTIGKNVQTIGGWAFSDCYNLESVVFQDPDGWSIDEGTSLKASDLSKTSKAAKYLRDKYHSSIWTKKQ